MVEFMIIESILSILCMAGTLFKLFLFAVYKIDGGKMTLRKWWKSV